MNVKSAKWLGVDVCHNRYIRRRIIVSVRTARTNQGSEMRTHQNLAFLCSFYYIYSISCNIFTYIIALKCSVGNLLCATNRVLNFTLIKIIG